MRAWRFGLRGPQTYSVVQHVNLECLYSQPKRPSIFEVENKIFTFNEQAREEIKHGTAVFYNITRQETWGTP